MERQDLICRNVPQTPAEVAVATASPSADQSVNAPRRLETKACSRCGGSGKMPYAVYGGVCFKCNGSGRLYTPRGRAARAFLDRLRQRTVEQIREGMLVFAEGFSAGSFSRPSKFHVVTSVDLTPDVNNQANIHTVGCQFGALPTSLFKMGHTALGKQRTLALALDYQDSLTKSCKLKAGVSWASPECWVKDAVKQGDPLLVRQTPKTTEVK